MKMGNCDGLPACAPLMIAPEVVGKNAKAGC